jgi:hypothetical protein
MLSKSLPLFLLVTSLCAQQSQRERFSAVADRLVTAINAADSAAVERECDTQMSGAVPEAKVEEVLAGLSAQLGTIQKPGRSAVRAGNWPSIQSISNAECAI